MSSHLSGFIWIYQRWNQKEKYKVFSLVEKRFSSHFQSETYYRLIMLKDNT